MRVGEQLEQIDRQRSRALDAKDLIQYFSEFNKGDTSRLQKLQTVGRDGEHKVCPDMLPNMSLGRHHR